MDFINKVTKTVNNIADKTANGVNKIADKAKLEYKMSNLKSKLDTYYVSIGQLKYSEMKGETVTPDMYEAIADEIRLTESEIAALREKLDKLNNYVICPDCGCNVKKGSRFCQNCGKKLD